MHRNLDAGVDLADLLLAGRKGRPGQVGAGREKIHQPAAQRGAQPLLDHGMMQEGARLFIGQESIVKGRHQGVGMIFNALAQTAQGRGVAGARKHAALRIR